MKSMLAKRIDPFNKSGDGFSLVELLVVIAVIGTVIGLSLPNFLGARMRARDTRVKGELNQLKTALQLYFNDFGQFPAQTPDVLKYYIMGCGASGTSQCPQSGCAVDFAAGGTVPCDTANHTVYMTQFPSQYGPQTSANSIFYYSDQTDFCLKVALENTSDGDAAASQARCSAICGGNASGSDYAVCSE